MYVAVERCLLAEDYREWPAVCNVVPVGSSK